jgi:hypothetical protein
MNTKTCAQCGQPAGPTPIRNGSVVFCGQRCYRESLVAAAEAFAATPAQLAIAGVRDERAAR